MASRFPDEERNPKSHPTIAAVGSITDINEEARHATEVEHELTLSEAFRLYPTAVGWSIFFSLGIIMMSFDPQLIGQLFATPAFQKDFGYVYDDSYIVSAAWQSGE